MRARHERERAEDGERPEPVGEEAATRHARATDDGAGEAARPREQHDAEQQDDDHVADARPSA